jgi:hypothetical protein
VRRAVEGLEVAPEAWKDLVLDVGQQSAANEFGDSKYRAPRSRRWFIEAHPEDESGGELVRAARIGIGEPTYLRAVGIGTRVEVTWVALAEPTEALDTDNGGKQLLVLVADVEPVEDRELVVLWLLLLACTAAPRRGVAAVPAAQGV